MATNSSVNLEITNNADGAQVKGGTTQRALIWSGADITLAGSGSYVHTYPAFSATLMHKIVGEIIIYPSTTAPTGTLLCNGQAVSRSTYSALFTAISTTFGSGDGSTTFNVPNLVGRFIVGRDSGTAAIDTIGETGGSTTISHSGTAVADHANHTHAVGTYDTANHSTASNTATTGSGNRATTGTHSFTGSSAVESATLTHTVTQPSDHTSVRPPYMVMNYFIVY